eukprot:CAMPEP_0177682798 /NCGR_PEP_ID=MMETSP0447-20121125/31444_1 /TAXON_ID=0 /ORGANISM="Stygamoeba regulata, Strain BSH-02190019" /LENGTH=94 /DNA_ID=CAMNT_0019192311 /DNA_START=221 /DNA_END=505 /DNA_ORIENTATION=+
MTAPAERSVLCKRFEPRLSIRASSNGVPSIGMPSDFWGAGRAAGELGSPCLWGLARSLPADRPVLCKRFEPRLTTRVSSNSFLPGRELQTCGRL